ncbi:MAG: DUF4062 domain-containing protein [Armatimonadetes bacterium]|nr:DUF4062 domain-containing protein [Armatimonadota bacterium]
MARTERVLSVFLASPSDVSEERLKLREIVADLNAVYARNLGCRLELLSWETDSYPSAGKDPQDVINHQLSDDYDIFIGVMWHRVGTPTKRSASGTMEEFERAKQRFDKDPESVRIMFYFKDEAVPPSQLDPNQLKKVQKFRAGLGKEGVLYWSFAQTEEFGDLARLHLERQVWSMLKEEASCTDSNAITINPSRNEEVTGTSEQRNPNEDIDSDLEMLDFLEIVEDEFANLTAIAERINSATEEIGTKIEARTQEIQTATTLASAFSAKEVKRLVSRVANDLSQYSRRMEAEVPLLAEAQRKGFTAVMHSINLPSEFSESNSDGLPEAIATAMALSIGMAGAKESMSSFSESLEGVPNLTSEFKKAKKSVILVLSQLVGEFSSGEKLLQEILRLLDVRFSNVPQTRTDPKADDTSSRGKLF